MGEKFNNVKNYGDKKRSTATSRWSMAALNRPIYGFILVFAILVLIAYGLVKEPLVFLSTVMMIYLGLTFIIFLFRTDDYWMNMETFRKTFYGLVIVLIFITPLISEFEVFNWQTLLQLAAAAIFIDLAVLQTPGISKIWNAEFDKEKQPRKILSDNTRLAKNSTTKATAFHTVISTSTENYRNIPSYESWSKYKNILLEYFDEYTSNLKLYVHIIELDFNDEQEIYNSAASSFELMMSYHGVEKKDFHEEEWNEFIERLDSRKQVIIESDAKEKVALMTYYGINTGFLLSVVGKGEVEANEVDVMYLINMANIFEWHMA